MPTNDVLCTLEDALICATLNVPIADANINMYDMFHIYATHLMLAYVIVCIHTVSKTVHQTVVI